MLTTSHPHERNGTLPDKPRKPRRSPKKKKTATPARTAADRIKLSATLVMGIVIPLLSLGLSNAGGMLARNDHNALAVLAFGLMGCVLTVSLSHLAWAVGDITKSPRWASWLLAITFDMVLVLAELCHVSAEAAGVGTVVATMMVAVAMLSMFLNCWAFLKYPTK
ncbi:hypothetical protein R5W24_003341 [Gemmata sp. JC717]|uniref:hypothetical protein n=1 Tax=Gemmata algarum TaxID=2975278 RepID=UPI0021BAC146|nr:hypothetical protein [Gemmata algarum]MDY3554222.1 hypothetical protein [Gemmata algarum]